jgi:hypothetical protein
MTDEKIVNRLKNKLAELKKDYEEMDELRDTFKKGDEWCKIIYPMIVKIYLLEQILGIEK